LVFHRNPDPKGAMSVIGYDYFEDHYRAERAGRGRHPFVAATAPGE